MNAIVPRGSLDVAASNPLIPKTLDEAARLAKIMSDMSLVPAHLQGKPADCMLVIEQAQRWRMSPFAVAQATSVLQGKLNFEGKLVAAALHTSGILSSRLRYDYRGDGDSREVTVSAVVIGETEPRDVLVRLREVKTANKMWTSQPDQQLAYAGARIWARRHASEVMLGVYAPEEFDPPPAPAPHRGPTLDHEPTHQVHQTPAPDEDGIPALDPEPRDERTIWTDNLVARIEAAGADELHEIAGNQKIADARGRLAEAGRADLADRIGSTLTARFTALAGANAPADLPA